MIIMKQATSKDAITTFLYYTMELHQIPSIVCFIYEFGGTQVVLEGIIIEFDRIIGFDSESVIYGIIDKVSIIYTSFDAVTDNVRSIIEFTTAAHIPAQIIVINTAVKYPYINIKY